MKRYGILSLGTLVVGLVFSTATLSAQGFGGGQGRGNFDPEEMQARMSAMMKERLQVNDEEWKVIQPLLEKVQTKQRESMGGRFRGAMMFGGRGMRGGDNAQNRPQRDRGDRPGMDEIQALSDALESESTSAADLKAKMAAVREARKKSEAELKAAREDLRKVLTTRQEATLMLMGMLD